MSSAIPIVDHDQVQQWIESHHGCPARVADDPGHLAIKFEHTQGEPLEELPWDRWLRWFDRNRLALVVSKNGFNKLVPR